MVKGQEFKLKQDIQGYMNRLHLEKVVSLLPNFGVIFLAQVNTSL